MYELYQESRVSSKEKFIRSTLCNIFIVVHIALLLPMLLTNSLRNSWTQGCMCDILALLAGRLSPPYPHVVVSHTYVLVNYHNHKRAQSF